MISVIIPVYNGEKHINNLLNYFNRQKIESRSELELVFVDDGSSDESLMLLNSIKTDKFNVSVYHQENQGVSAARNLGIEKASGDYISFVDVDDALTDDYFETLLKTKNENHFDLFVFKTVRIRNRETLFSKSDYKNKIERISNNDILHRMLSNPTDFGVYNLLIKREFLIKNNLLFLKGFNYYEDYDFLFRIFALSETTLISEKQLYFYILQENSAMQKFTKDRLTCISLMRDLEPFFLEKAPEFYDDYKKFGVARIYWSVLWQAALAFDYSGFKTFSTRTGALTIMRGLRKFPDRKVRFSSVLFSFNSFIYYKTVRLLGKRRSKIESVSIDTFKDLW